MVSADRVPAGAAVEDWELLGDICGPSMVTPGLAAEAIAAARHEERKKIMLLRTALSALVPTDTHHLPVCDCACCRARAALRETAP